MIVARCDRAVVSVVCDVILICFYLLRCLSTRFPLFFPSLWLLATRCVRVFRFEAKCLWCALEGRLFSFFCFERKLNVKGSFELFCVTFRSCVCLLWCG